MDSVRAAFFGRDAAAMEAALAEADENGDGAQRIALDINIGGGAIATADGADGSAAAAKPVDPLDARFKAIEDLIGGLATQVGAIAATKATADAAAAATAEAAAGEGDAGTSEEADPEDAEDVDTKNYVTMDAAAFGVISNRTLADAEIIAPGISKTMKATMDSLDASRRGAQIRALKRNAITVALSDPKRRDMVAQITRGLTPDKMAPAVLHTTFDSAMALCKMANNAAAGRNLGVDAKATTPSTIADQNQRNQDFWSGKAVH